MSKRQYAGLLAAAIVAGLLGGVVSSYFMVERLMAAQKVSSQVVEQPPHAATVIQAERFEVVGKDGKIRAVLGEPTPSFLSSHLERPEESRMGEDDEVLVGLWILDEAEKIRTGLYTESYAWGAGDPHLRLIGEGGASSHFRTNSIDLHAPHESQDTWMIPYIGSGPSIQLFGAKGRSVYVDAGENPGVEGDGASLQLGGMFQNNQAYYASLSLKANGPSLELRDQAGKPRAVLG